MENWFLYFGLPEPIAFTAAAAIECAIILTIVLVAAAQEVGIGVWSIHAWFSGDVLKPEEAVATTAGLKRATEVALGLGAGRIVHHTSGQTLDGDGPQRLRAEAEVIAAAWQAGIHFALENGSTLAQMEYVIALVDALGPRIAGVCVDTGHANIGGELGAPRALRMAGQRLITTHLQDNHGRHDEHVPPGDGNIDWEEAALALREIGYDGCLMLELTDHPSAERVPQIREEIGRGAKMARWLAGEVWPGRG